MPAARLSSSSRNAAALALSLSLGLTGCTGSTGQLRSTAETPLRLTTMDDNTNAAAAPPAIRPTAETPVRADIVTVPAARPRSAWCDYLSADAAADATILRAPTLNGQVDEDQAGSVSVSLSLSGFRKATLIEESAEARCRSHMAESGLQKLVFIAPQSLSAAGYRAKSAAIERRLADLDKMRTRIRRELSEGAITAEKAASLNAMIESLQAAAAEARSEADRRASAEGAISGPAAQYSAELLRAESDLSDIASRMRTADAFDVSLEAGYSDGGMDDGFDRIDDGVTGKVSFSMKLGAFAPQRYAHEERAKAARLAAIRDQEGGALWQIRALREAHLRAISGLEDSRMRLDRAIEETRRFMATVEATPEPEFAGAAMEARLRLIALESDRAAVAGSLSDIRGKLKQLAPG